MFITEAYLEPSRISMMQKGFFIDVSKYTSGISSSLSIKPEPQLLYF